MPCQGQVDTRPHKEAWLFSSGSYGKFVENALLMSINVELWLLKHTCACVKHVCWFHVYILFTYCSLLFVWDLQKVVRKYFRGARCLTDLVRCVIVCESVRLFLRLSLCYIYRICSYGHVDKVPIFVARLEIFIWFWSSVWKNAWLATALSSNQATAFLLMMRKRYLATTKSKSNLYSVRPKTGFVFLTIFTAKCNVTELIVMFSFVFAGSHSAKNRVPRHMHASRSRMDHCKWIRRPPAFCHRPKFWEKWNSEPHLWGKKNTNPKP